AAQSGGDSSGSAEQTRRHRKKDGNIITVETTASDLNVGGQHVRLTLVRDVTEREQGPAGLRNTGELIDHVAHEFSNLLTVVASYACMLEEGLREDETRQHDAAQIR